MALEQEQLYDELSGQGFVGPILSRPDPTIEEEIRKIYVQAHCHRDRLIGFYIGYTIIFSMIVIGFMVWQGLVRAAWDKSFEIMPQWGLNLLIVGMFGQFIGLLTIVTKNVWNFKPFLDHHRGDFHKERGK